MLLPAQDQSYERFWRQAVRWLAQSAPEPVSMTLPPAPAPGDAIPVSIAARDRSYAPRADAIVDVHVTAPSGRVDTVRAEAYRGLIQRLEPLGDRPVGGDEHRHLGRRLDRFPFRRFSRPLRPQVARQHERTPHDGRTARIVGQRLEAEGLG